MIFRHYSIAILRHLQLRYRKSDFIFESACLNCAKSIFAVHWVKNCGFFKMGKSIDFESIIDFLTRPRLEAWHIMIHWPTDNCVQYLIFDNILRFELVLKLFIITSLRVCYHFRKGLNVATIYNCYNFQNTMNTKQSYTVFFHSVVYYSV